MKISKIKLGLVTLASIATILGFAVGCKAETIEPKKSINTHFEIGSYHRPNSNVNLTKKTIDLKIQGDDLAFSTTGSHTNYDGVLEGKNVKGYANSLRVEVGKEWDKKLFLSPYIELKDDADPIREFRKNKVSAFSLGISGERLIVRPITLVGDFRISDLEKEGFDYSANLGLIYYFNDDWASLRAVSWRESLRDVDTTMAYLLLNHKFNEKLKATIHGGYGKEHGSRWGDVSDIGARISYDINKKLSLDLDYSHYEAENKRKTYGVGLTWRF